MDSEQIVGRDSGCQSRIRQCQYLEVEVASMKVHDFDPKEWVSVGAAAMRADVTRNWMRTLAKEGKVRSIVINDQWFIYRADAEGFVRSETRGRPRMGKRNGAKRSTRRA